LAFSNTRLRWATITIPKIGARVIKVLEPAMGQMENKVKKLRYSESRIVKILEEGVGSRLIKEVQVRKPLM
jgi:hypothetical protein